MPMIVKAGVSAEDLQLLEVYESKQRAIGDYIHSWYRIGLTANSILLAVTAFVLKPVEASPQQFRDHLLAIWPIGLGISLFGLWMALAWFFGNRNTAKWQRVTNDLLTKVEAALIANPGDHGLWTAITTEDNKAPSSDVTDRMLALPVAFGAVWIAVGVSLAFLR